MADFQLKIGNPLLPADPSTETPVDFGESRVQPLSLRVALDAPREFTFSQVGRAQWDGEYTPGDQVILYDTASSPSPDANIIFRGEVVDREADGSPSAERINYRCMGPRYLANAYVTVADKDENPEGVIPATGTVFGQPHITYNAKRGDVDYDPSREWLTVGEILVDLFKNNVEALHKAGAVPSSTDPTVAYDSDELDELKAAPPEPIVFSNTPFADAIAQILEWEPQIVWFIDPVTLIWHFRSLVDGATYGVTNTTIELADQDSYQVMTDTISESVQDCSTRLMIHGGLKTASTEFYLNDDTKVYRLQKGWDHDDPDLEDGWTIQDAWSRPSDHSGGDQTYHPTTTGGDIDVTWNGARTVVTIDGANFGTDNFWRHGWIEFKTGNVAGTLGERLEHRRITSNTIDTITYTPPMLFGTGDVKSVRLINPVAQKWFVWRRFELWEYDPVGDTWVEQVEVANIADPWMAVVGGQYMTNTTPTLQAVHNIDPTGTNVPMRINAAVELIDDGEAFVANMPLCALTMKPVDLYDSTVDIDPPDEVIFTAPRVIGNLAAVYPPDSGASAVYANDSNTGVVTAEDRFGLERTRHIYMPEWKNDQQQQLFNNLAKDLLRPWMEVKQSGSIELAEYQENFMLRNTASPRVVSITTPANWAPSGSSTTTNWNRLQVKQVELSWSKSGAPAQTTSLTIDNNQRPGRTQDELMLAVQNASSFITLNYTFGAQNLDMTVMRIAVDQRIMNPDLVR